MKRIIVLIIFFTILFEVFIFNKDSKNIQQVSNQVQEKEYIVQEKIILAKYKEKMKTKYNSDNKKVLDLGTKTPYPNLLVSDIKKVTLLESGMTQYEHVSGLIIMIDADKKIYYFPQTI